MVNFGGVPRFIEDLVDCYGKHGDQYDLIWTELETKQIQRYKLDKLIDNEDNSQNENSLSSVLEKLLQVSLSKVSLQKSAKIGSFSLKEIAAMGFMQLEGILFVK